MKNIFFITFILSISALLIGAEVDIEKARRVAGNIYAERLKMSNADELEFRSIDIIEENSTNLFYVFQLAPKGFIIVSGDDRVQPLLAYSSESSFVLEDMPSNISWFVDAYKEMVINAINSHQSATQETYNNWQKYFSGTNLNRNRDMKGPLLVSTINQSGGWNDYCPGDCEGGDEVPNGCVAVSMVALMHYWQYPTVGTGSNSCYCGGFGTQSADFSSVYYDYESMGTANSASDAAALLLWHAGVAVNMDYDCPGSGAQVSGGYPSAQYALENNFLYKDNIYTSYRSSSSDSQWINYLVTEIDNNRPMIYVGWNDEGGHAWNCDGYDDELFHMNWGWGGQSNGWFTVTGSTDPDGWGDGSHILRNIEPESLNRPNLKLANYSSYEVSGDGDLVINPGEAFEILFELENPTPWADATSIEILLTTEEEGVSIDGNTSSIVSFEVLEAGDIFSNASMPFSVELDNDINLGKKTFNLMVMGVGNIGEDDNFYYNEYELEVLVSLNQYGFPIYNASQKTSPLAVDIDNDGNEEIIYGDYNGFVHVLNLDGSEIEDETFPFDTGDQIWGAAASSDMDGDGLIDIAVTSKSKHLYIFDNNGLKVDYDAESWLLGSPAIGNIDDDDDLEVVVGGFSSNMKKIFAINHDGSDVPGYPLDIGERMFVGIALADFNNNGKDDIVVGTESDYLHLFYDDGSEADGFPYQAGDKLRSAPAILDVDGQKVIFVGSNDNNLYAINADGSLRFTVEATDDVFNSPAFLEHDNTFYVFFSDDSGILYAVDTDGNSLEGWPIDAGAVISNSIAFSDMNNDGNAEVIAVTELADVMAFNLDGTHHDGFPMTNEFTFSASPMVMDMDGDGDLEILAGSVNSLVALDIKSSGNNNGYWNMYRGNNQRTGYKNYSGDSECGVAMGDVTGDGIVNILDLVQVVNLILEISLPLYECAADFNQDGTVNILDLVQIANNILDN